MAAPYVRPRVRSTTDSIDFEQPYPPGWFDRLIERDALARVSTWPWEPATVTVFVTTMVLPAIVWVLQRVLTRMGL